MFKVLMNLTRLNITMRTKWLIEVDVSHVLWVGVKI